VIDASSAAITLAILLTDEELESLEKRAGDEEIARGGRSRGSDVASPQPAAHGEAAQVFPANAAAPDGRPRLTGVICGSGSRAVRGQFTISGFTAPILRARARTRRACAPRLLHGQCHQKAELRRG